MDNSKLTIMAICVAAIMACVGAGYALEYSGSTVNSNNNLTAIYMVAELNDMAVSADYTFDFDDITYYRDTTVTRNTVNNTYKSATGESSMVKLYIRSTGIAPVEPPAVNNVDSLTVKLDDEYTDATYTMYFYDANQTQVGTPIVLTDQPQAIIIEGGVAMDTIYYCKVTVAIANATLNLNPFGTLSLGVTFTATASDGT